MATIAGASGAPRAWRILSIDGGGVRGYFAALLIARLTAAQPGWLDKVDLIAGTSTGAIIALCLGMTMAPSEIAAIYAREAERIFSTSLVDRVLDAGGLIGPRYDVRRFAAILRQVFRDTRFADLKRKVMVPAFDLDDGNPDPARRRWRARFFQARSDASMLVRRAALYSSAVPAVFATADGHVDGGVFAANPAMCALSLSLDDTVFSPPALLGGVRLFSIGTGQSALHIEGERLQWGLSQWARPLLGVLFDAGIGVVDYQCERLLGPHYHRLNPWLDGEEIQLDDASAMPRLAKAADTAPIDASLNWIDAVWNAA